MICIQAKLDPQAAAESLAEGYSQLLNDDVYIEHVDAGTRERRNLTYRSLLLATVHADCTIVVHASLAELAPLARVA